MICLLSGFQPEAMENFRAEEIGDKDSDRSEFHDAWGTISFIRWPTGFDGPITLIKTRILLIQTDRRTVKRCAVRTHISQSATVSSRHLIYSPGLDQEYGWCEGQNMEQTSGFWAVTTKYG